MGEQKEKSPVKTGKSRLDPSVTFTPEEIAKWPWIQIPGRGDDMDRIPVQGSINGLQYCIPKNQPVQVHPEVRNDLLNLTETRYRTEVDLTSGTIPPQTKIVSFKVGRFNIQDIDPETIRIPEAAGA